jgi:hypothetical protein
MGTTVDRNVDEYMELAWLEIWKDIEWYEWLYKVSNLWRIKSVNRTIDVKRSFNGKVWEAKYNVQWWIVQQWIDKNWLHSVSLINWWSKTRKTFSVMKLVYCTFKWQTRDWFRRMLQHKDWNKDNNRFDNIQLHNQKHHTTYRRASYQLLKQIESSGISVDWIYDILNKLENNWKLEWTSIGKKALDTENLILDFVEEKNKWVQDEDDIVWIWDFTLLEFFTRIQKMKLQ